MKNRGMCGQKIYDRENKEICNQNITSSENGKQQYESERVKDKIEEQRVVGLADTLQPVSESVKNDNEE